MTPYEREQLAKKSPVLSEFMELLREIETALHAIKLALVVIALCEFVRFLKA